MDIINSFQTEFREEIDKAFSKDAAYRQAADDLRAFAENNLPEEKIDEFENLVSLLASAVEHSAFEAGTKVGAKVVAHLLK